ncbi:ATP/GTP-binding protein [Anaerolinea sp.]|uniref:AAA family ATPase n=1 Tax=Anaerolinea sp. TaxID=1872519 RepID=UPI0026328982|nr:ATP-binding protein [uncultured Anaerolinea sp.]
MLIEFSVSNFRSFSQPVILSLLATPLKEKDSRLNTDNLFEVNRLKLLRSAAIYGANASGKSNLVKAIGFMRRFVLDSATEFQSGEKIPVDRFRLSREARQKPAFFQIIFSLNGKRYRYGFELDEEQVHGEWLYQTVQRESLLFIREKDQYEVSTSFRREAPVKLQEMTRTNALFLSVMAQFNSPRAVELLNWFRKSLRVVSGLKDEFYAPYTMEQMEKDETFRRFAREMVRMADTGITDLSVKSEVLDSASFPAELRKLIQEIAEKEGKTPDELSIQTVETRHPVYEGETFVGSENFDIDEESDGSQKFFFLLGPLFYTLKKGNVLVIDELDARLHPSLTREIVRMFNSPETNPYNAQLIFATHDAGLLGECLLRRDQVWFTQKNRFGASELYSLAEMKERKDASYLKNYLAGRYGGIPLLGGLRPFVEEMLKHDTNTEAERSQ